MSPQEFECCACRFRNRLERIECAARLVLIHGKDIGEAAHSYEIWPDEVEHVVRSYLEIRATPGDTAPARMTLQALYCSLEQAA